MTAQNAQNLEQQVQTATAGQGAHYSGTATLSCPAASLAAVVALRRGPLLLVIHALWLAITLLWIALGWVTLLRIALWRIALLWIALAVVVCISWRRLLVVGLWRGRGVWGIGGAGVIMDLVGVGGGGALRFVRHVLFECALTFSQVARNDQGGVLGMKETV